MFKLMKKVIKHFGELKEELIIKSRDSKLFIKGEPLTKSIAIALPLRGRERSKEEYEKIEKEVFDTIRD